MTESHEVPLHFFTFSGFMKMGSNHETQGITNNLSPIFLKCLTSYYEQDTEVCTNIQDNVPTIKNFTT